MNDTSPAMEALLTARFAAMTGAERLLMALQMFETAQKIVLSSLSPGPFASRCLGPVASPLPYLCLRQRLPLRYSRVRRATPGA